MQELLMSYLEDSQYSLAAVDEFFASFGGPTRMFNPLSSHTKVAVTTTTAKDVKTYLITNYNGRSRSQGSSPLGYDLIRARDPSKDTTLSQA